MKNSLVSLILVFALLAMHILIHGQSNWERYEPRTLKQIVRANYDPDMGNGDHFSTKEFASIVVVTYTGLSRRIPLGKKKLILALKNVHGSSNEYLSQFEQEYLFVEDSVEYWIPVQTALVPGLNEDVRKGERIKLYVIWAGYRQESGKVEPVLLLNRFVTRSDERQILTRREIVAKAYAATVLIIGVDRKGKPILQGSGFFVAPNVIATNYHVVVGASGVYAKQRGSESYKATVLRVDKNSDLALLETRGLSGTPLELFPGNDLYVGDEIYVVGNPKGLDATFSTGNISAFREARGITYVQVSAPVSSGSSGGPVLNQYGEVIGIVQSQFSEGQNLNFAVLVIHLSILVSGERDIKVVPSYPR